MKVSQEAKNVYERTNKIWEDNGFTIRFGEPNEPADFKTAVQCIKAFWLKEFNQEFPYKIENATYDYAIGLTRKRKDSWIVEDLSNSGRRDNKSKIKGFYTFKLFPESGWANIIHETGHLAGLKLGHRHNAEHACIELRFTKFFFSKNYIEKSRKRLEANPPSYKHLLDSSGKIKKQKPKRISYKKKCISLAGAVDWLYFDNDNIRYHTPMWEFEDKRITKACSKYSNLWDTYSYEDIAADYWCEYKWELENLTWKERYELLSKHRYMTNKDIDGHAKNIMKGI